MSNIKISHGTKDNDIIVGNVFDKYGSYNPIVRWMMNGFDSALSYFVSESSPRSIHEIGCGEGYWVLKWNEQGYAARGSDFSAHVIDIARENATKYSLPDTLFNVRSIYDLKPEDSADLVVCCEVLEHLESYHDGLKALQKIVTGHLIVSVPREPLWRVLNMARGKYLTDWGNTPGHLQHWSQKAFFKLAANYFKILQVKSPIPWTMIFCRPYT